MRFLTRIMLGVAVTVLVALIAPAAANATAGSTASDTRSSDVSWGSYYSTDHKAKASGHVSVDKKRVKHWYVKWVPVKKRVCWEDRKGHKHCKWVVKKIKKHVWQWRYDRSYTVHSTLSNHKWAGRNKCAWETFKVVRENGSSYVEQFRNCGRHPRHFAFHAEDAVRIHVDVSRGNRHHPTGHHSGWRNIFHAAA
ncbi:hypothetical protein FE391_17150 [Nonomuraea sp. KC401]|uniref:hypothetical protein n=1 Tax=unclassified Nonomuraea TaxID=2593643 RepID=UPI0010FF1A28|nr:MULTISPECIES: hypothetical protein [unclassified Nonomuraea]NBE94886.1 hypothetical protein [Nonomuraea sp. K271]TLF72257.1 hypothetical protein FE391_17150 [Nonomuraea sp. KC401]